MISSIGDETSDESTPLNAVKIMILVIVIVMSGEQKYILGGSKAQLLLVLL